MKWSFGFSLGYPIRFYAMAICRQHKRKTCFEILNLIFLEKKKKKLYQIHLNYISDDYARVKIHLRHGMKLEFTYFVCFYPNAQMQMEKTEKKLYGEKKFKQKIPQL